MSECMIDFFMEMKIPSVTAQQKRMRIGKGGKPQFFGGGKIRAARTEYCWHLSGHRPPKPLEGAVSLTVIFAYRANRQHKAGEYKVTRPDTDNMLKLLKDCMTECGFWKDDSQVAVELTTKLYWQKEGIFVRVGEMNDGKE